MNGKLLNQKGTLKNGVATIPILEIAEALGVKVTWNEEKSTVNVEN
ncbi:stalk domain-containing protein [Paenibacillus sp. PL2-23]